MSHIYSLLRLVQSVSCENVINLRSKVNAIQTSLTRKLGLRICKTDVNTQKIDGSRLETDKMVITSFYIREKDRKSSFFEETFLLPDMNMNIAFEILFFTLSNVEVNFHNWELR